MARDDQRTDSTEAPPADGASASRAVQTADTFTLAATGDAILTRPLAPYEGTSHRFDRLLGLLRDADAAVTNLEVLVHDYEPSPAADSGGTYMRAPPAVLDELRAAGVNLFSAATNHTGDYGEEGVRRTLAALRERGLAFAGLGDTLYEARRPGYVETPAGRVGMVTACTSYTPGSEAGEQTAAMRGRPGLNPLSVEKVYRVPPDRLDDLRRVSEAAGLETIKRDWLDRGLYFGHDWNDDSYFHFGDMKFLPADDEDDAGVSFVVDDADEAALVDWVGEADANADFTVATVHTHQGVGGRQTTTETPAFLREVAHRCIDAGADAFVATGPHVLRGVETYRGRPVFYSLGNFAVQNETVSRLPPESFERYGLGDSTKVSDVFDARLYDGDEPKGDLANRRFWETVVPTCRFDADGGLERVELHPCTLQRSANRPQRGIPVLATGDEATSILRDVADLSRPFGTTLSIADDTATVDLE